MAWMRIVDRYKESKSELYPDTQETQPMPDSSISNTKSGKRKSLYLDGNQKHTVWTPKQSRKRSGALSDIVMEVVKNRQSLLERQQRVQSRVMATQHVLKVQRDVLTEEESGRAQQSTAEKPKKWGKVITKVMEENTKVKKTPSKRSTHFHDIVSQYMEATTESDRDDTQPTTAQAKVAALTSLRHWKNQLMEVPQQKRMQEMPTEASIPIPMVVHHEPSDAPPITEQNEM